jgi:thiamine pyrophosphokinase
VSIKEEISAVNGVVVSNGSIGNLTFYNKYFQKAELIICADGGARHLRRLGISPHIILGDFDSISGDDLNFFTNAGAEVVKFPAEKDKTDTELAVDIAVDRGCSEITIIGGLGSRMDHTLANIFILKRMLERGAKGLVVDEHNEITLIKDSITLKKDEAYRLSLLPVTGSAEGVSTRGLYYPLHDAVLELGSTWGVSNEFVSDEVEVTIKKGLLLVIKSRD